MTDAFTELLRDQGELPCHSAPQLFFEQDIDSAETDTLSTATRFLMAKTLCNGCPIRQACLHHAITENINHGVWGQTSPSERYMIRKA